jgi:UDP:flavonoid glycosyltransferase YjiC (YdhE family)
MKITLATCGSRGDVQPILALAMSLKSAGHDVLLAAPPENANWIQSYHCPFRPLIGNVHALLENCPNAHTIKPTIFFLRFVRQDLENQFSVLPSIVEGSDLVLGASLAFGMHSVAESLGIPYRFIALTPQLLPSSQHPFPAIRNQYLPPWLNRLSWRLAKVIDKLNLTALIRKQRRRLGLKPISDALSHILGSHVIVASDPLLGEVPPDVKQDTTQTGYFHLKQTGELSADIEKFLAAGHPPVYVGFGSMPSHDQKANLPLILEAARSAGQRVIVSNKLDQGHSSSASEDCFFVNNVPHTFLFQRLAAVVHHGGAGTTATAAWSGVPQIIVPHILDQYYWARRIRHLGMGPRPIWRSRLTAGRLAAALRECVSNKNMQQRSKKVAEIIQRQDTLGKAVRLIESEVLAEKQGY